MRSSLIFEPLGPGAMPLVVRPFPGAAGGSAVARDMGAGVACLSEQLPVLTDALHKHGALLFRGFPVGSADDFARVVQLFGGSALDYVGGNVPRSRINRIVFNSTELPRAFKLQLHNELAYQRDYPDLIFFYCHTPALRGGETTIADCRRIYHDLDPGLREKFLRKRVRYVRTFQERRPLRERIKKSLVFYQHLTWQDAFKVESRADAEARCRARGMSYEWRPNGDLAVSNELPAFLTHPVTGEPSWFNQVIIMHFNRRSFGTLAYGFRALMYREKTALPHQVYFGDGSEISPDEINHVMDVADRHTIRFPWHAGDVMLVDNRLTAHGRDPYQGPRKVYVAMLKEQRQAGAAVAGAGAP